MPGLLNDYDSHRRANPAAERRPRAPSIQSQQRAAPHLTPMPTAYGLNEPQWSGYRGDPPPLVFSRSPYARIPLPSMHTKAVLNPVLLPPNLELPALKPGHNVSIKWDITKHQSSAKLVPQPHQSSPYCAFMRMPALSPADTPSLTIRLRPYGRPIVLMAHYRAPGAVVPITVGDVLRAIYEGARRATSERTMQSVNLDPGLLWSAIAGVGFQPADDALGDPSMGAKDALCMNVAHDLNFHVHWFGLVPSKTEADVWVLQTVETQPIKHNTDVR
ncbi:hypothetical protein D9619_006886 [Psilocybe cf. subviscida]|uniref:DUF6699 domain-containing protein n=1 Tax=Psilocybe cf. subviscida TaxID=2480587 RepID=A0A8H5B5V1_9AGAR|nr:hypothetical protein D9619_006886 [Psilocybe cf. subviscida]